MAWTGSASRVAGCITGREDPYVTCTGAAPTPGRLSYLFFLPCSLTASFLPFHPIPAQRGPRRSLCPTPRLQCHGAERGSSLVSSPVRAPASGFLEDCGTTLSMTAQSLPRLDCRGASSAKTCMGLGKAEIKKKKSSSFSCCFSSQFRGHEL